MSAIKRLIYRITINNIYIDTFIKIIEYVRGLYRYPKKMLGRKLSHHMASKDTDVLVFAAHPDDEILGVGTCLYRHRQNREKISVAYVTNGTGGKGASWKFKTNVSQNISETRYMEGVHALSLIDMNKEDVFCLGYPDAGTHRYLKNIARDVLFLIQTLNPKKIYVHCIEGGHSDHDITSFVVKSVCEKVRFTNVFEWAEYHRLQPIGTRNVNFTGSRYSSSEEAILNISNEEQMLKRKMLACHESQGVVKHYMMGEAIRQANLFDLKGEFLDYSKLPRKRLNSLIGGFYKFLDKSRRFKMKQSEYKIHSSNTYDLASEKYDSHEA